MATTVRKVANRFKEPSTWVALGSIGALFGVAPLAALGIPETATTMASLAALLLGMVLPETRSNP